MIALIAGTGDLPRLIVQRLVAAGKPPLICELVGLPADLPADLPRLTFRIETLGSFLAALTRMGITQVCLAGAVQRPRIDPSLIDDATKPLVPRMMAAMAKGDDGALRELLALIEEQGMSVVGASDVAPDLLPVPGILTAAQPDARHATDAVRGEAEIAAMGRADVGQACVVRAGEVIAREDVAGTDAMLLRIAAPRPVAQPWSPPVADPLWLPLDLAGGLVAGAADWLSGGEPESPGSGAILFKAPKPGQDRRVDLPVIGPQTARNAVQAGLAGIVIEAGGVMALDLPATVATLDDAGLFLWVRPASP